jgi:hypothetical protein
MVSNLTLFAVSINTACLHGDAYRSVEFLDSECNLSVAFGSLHGVPEIQERPLCTAPAARIFKIGYMHLESDVDYEYTLLDLLWLHRAVQHGARPRLETQLSHLATKVGGNR